MKGVTKFGDLRILWDFFFLSGLLKATCHTEAQAFRMTQSLVPKSTPNLPAEKQLGSATRAFRNHAGGRCAAEVGKERRRELFLGLPTKIQLDEGSQLLLSCFAPW